MEMAAPTHLLVFAVLQPLPHAGLSKPRAALRIASPQKQKQGPLIALQSAGGGVLHVVAVWMAEKEAQVHVFGELIQLPQDAAEPGGAREEGHRQSGARVRQSD